MNRNQRRATAKSARISYSPPAKTPEALCELGFALLKSGQVGDAERCCQQALSQQPNFADALHLMGMIAVSRRQYDHAVEWIAAALRQTPKAGYLLSLGNVLQLLGRMDEALSTFDKGVALKPDDVGLWSSMGLVLTRLERTNEAILVFQHVLKLDPRHKEAALMCARLLFESERFDEAAACYDVCAEIEPDRAEVYQIRGVCHARASRFEQAIADYETALKLDPDHADTLHNLGQAHLKCFRYELAARFFDRALALAPDMVPYLLNKGVAAAELQWFDEAFAAYGRALAIEPNNAKVQWNQSLLHLLTGNFADGWAGHEARWRANVGIDCRFVQPPWLGQEPIADKVILLHSEQGFGDTIQFSRYVPMVAALGARIILEVEPAMLPLLSGMPGVAHSLARGSALPDFDYHCPLSSLPLVFQTRIETIPAPISCLASIPKELQERFESWLGPHDRLRVGLVWSGRAQHKNDHNRSTTLHALSSLLDLEATFVSLQKDPREQDRMALRERADILDANQQLTDFVATAALVSRLDLVITVDTSVAHLAGTLGCPVWIMLPFAPDYRWLLEREDSPWYPSARLFRQTATRDYAPVVERMKSELQALLAAWKPSGS
jgi:tetratricopeptide (TPR) repeat protein